MLYLKGRGDHPTEKPGDGFNIAGPEHSEE